MAANNAVLYLETPENTETAGDTGMKYQKSEEDLAAKLQLMLDDPAGRRHLAARAKQRADALYRWETIAQKYERVFGELVKD
jgi:glycosyltransferase involved in cell wall biosynthesis